MTAIHQDLHGEPEIYVGESPRPEPERRHGHDRRRQNVGRLGGDRRTGGDRRRGAAEVAAPPVEILTPWQLPPVETRR